MSERKLSRAELDAVATLAKGGRIIVLLVPRGIHQDDVQRITREASAQLDELVAQRDRTLS